MRFTSSFHPKTTKQLSGSANPQHVLLDWNQKPSAKKAFGPISSDTSALWTQHLHCESAGQHSCMVQPSKKQGGRHRFESSSRHTPLIISAGAGPVRARSPLASLLQKHIGGLIPNSKAKHWSRHRHQTGVT